MVAARYRLAAGQAASSQIQIFCTQIYSISVENVFLHIFNNRKERSRSVGWLQRGEGPRGTRRGEQITDLDRPSP